MSLYLVGLAVIAGVGLIGAVIVRAVALIPLSVLGRSEDGGRFAGLGSRNATFPATPPAGRAVLSLVPARAMVTETA